MAHGDAREGKWRGKCWMEWVASTLTPPPNVLYPALLKLMRTPRLLAVDWTDALTDLNGLVGFGKRRNLVSARVPSRSARAITQYALTNETHKFQAFAVFCMLYAFFWVITQKKAYDKTLKTFTYTVYCELPRSKLHFYLQLHNFTNSRWENKKKIKEWWHHERSFNREYI